MSAPFVPVTGPDGDNPITRAQLEELQRSIPSRGAGREIHIHIRDALGYVAGERYRGAYYNAMCYCAGVYNARHGGKP